MITEHNYSQCTERWCIVTEQRNLTLLSSRRTPDTVFLCVSIELEMHSKLSAAYAGRHYAQHGSGTCTGCPGSFRGPAAVCWPHSAEWGQFAFGVFLSLGMQRLAHLEIRFWGYRLYTSGMNQDRAGDQLFTDNMCFVFVKQGVTHLMTNVKHKGSSHRSLLFPCNSQVEKTLLCIWFDVCPVLFASMPQLYAFLVHKYI